MVISFSSTFSESLECYPKISPSVYFNSIIMSHGSNVVIKQHLDSYADDHQHGCGYCHTGTAFLADDDNRLQHSFTLS